MHNIYYVVLAIKEAAILHMHGCNCWSVAGSVRGDAPGSTVAVQL